MYRDELIKINKEDLIFIVGEEYDELVFIAKFNSFCRNCMGRFEVEMVDYKIYINHLNDIVFKGKCKTCKKKLIRIIELGENSKYFMKTAYIKEKRSKT